MLIKRKKIDLKVFIIITTVISLLVSNTFLSNEIYIIYQNLFYIPVLLSCFRYGKKGLIYSMVITSTHFLLFMKYNIEPLLDELVRVFVFNIVGYVAYKLTDNIKSNQAKIIELDKKLKNEVERYKKAEMLSHLGNYELNLKTGKAIWSDELFRIFGYEPNSFEPTRDKRIELTYEDDKKFIMDCMDKVINQNIKFLEESRIIKPDGTIRWVLSSGYVEYDENNEPVNYICSILDITERKLLEKSLYEEKEKLKITISSIGDGVISTDINGKVTILNKVAEELTGWTQEEALGKPMDDVFNIINENTRVKCKNPVKNVIESGSVLGLANHTALISRNGAERSIADSAAPIKDKDGIIKGAILVFRDVTEEKKRQDEMYYISYHDALTGLYNRRFFEEEIKRMNIERNLPISVIMGDVNGLKLTNDAFSHHIGDKLLKKATEAIKLACRADDIVARWGGDEFTILLPKTNKEETKTIVSRIKNICSDMKVNGINVSISFGFDTKESIYEDIFKKLKSAEEYMYKNKTLESKNLKASIINRILNILYENNPNQELHSLRVSELSQKIGMAMNLSAVEIKELKFSGLLHDIGKIALDKNILVKLEPPTYKELNEIKKHPEIGYRILSSSSEMVGFAQYVLYHHERVDGTGYPKGLKGEEIPLLSRIIAVPNAYDKMTNEMVNEKVFCKDLAIAELIKNKGTQFDSNVVDVFIENVLNKA